MNAHGKRLGSLLPVLLAPFVMGSLCSGTSESVLDPRPDEFTKTVTLRSSDTESCVHLFAPGEDFPCCQVCATIAGNRRAVAMTLARQQTYTFRTGRNGLELDTQVCRVVGGESDPFEVS